MENLTTEDERREAKRAYMRAYQKANPDKFQSYRDKQDKTKRAAYNREYHAANKERLKQIAKEWREKNAEKVRTDRARYKDAHREKINAEERTRYHATKAEKSQTPEWKARIKRNNMARPAKVLARNEITLGRVKPAVCEACGGNDGGIVFDHCHEHGHARGWLCDRCNVALGCLRDNIDRLHKLIAYLERTKDPW
jgi:ribosomal protein RSM22 (predicted rRNA methylase)